MRSVSQCLCSRRDFDRGAGGIDRRRTLHFACESCVEVCMTDAIVLVETVEPEPAALVQTPGTPIRQSSTESVSPALRAASAAPVPGVSRIASLERMLSGIFSFAALAFDLKQGVSARRQPRSAGGPGRASGAGAEDAARTAGRGAAGRSKCNREENDMKLAISSTGPIPPVLWTSDSAGHATCSS